MRTNAQAFVHVPHRARQAAPKPDRICEILDQETLAFRTKNFNNFINTGNRAIFRPTTTAGTLLDREGETLGWDTYQVDIWGAYSAEISVQVRSDGVLRVQHKGKWVSVTKYLRRLKVVIDPGYAYGGPEYCTKLQSEWWAQNGKTFPIMRLPRELRDIICSHAFEPKIEPFPTSSARRGAIANRSTVAALLRVSKQINAECLDLLGRQTPFLVRHYGIFNILLAKPLQCRQVQRLELALSHRAIFRIFGLDVNSTEDDPSISNYAGRSLRKLSLKKLTLRLAPPDSAVGSRRLQGACQKIVVDCILTKARQSIRGHPVEITGYIKQHQRAFFEERYRRERRRYEFWNKERVIGGEMAGDLEDYDEWLEWIDEDEQEEEDGGVSIVDRTDDYVPTTVITGSPEPCRCNKLCTNGDWMDED